MYNQEEEDEVDAIVRERFEMAKKLKKMQDKASRSNADSDGAVSKGNQQIVGPTMKAGGNVTDANQQYYIKKWRDIYRGMKNAASDDSGGGGDDGKGKAGGRSSGMPGAKRKRSLSEDRIDARSSTKISAKRGGSPKKVRASSSSNDDEISPDHSDWKEGSHGIMYKDLKVGDGAVAKVGKKVKVTYEGRLTESNRVFELNRKGFKFKIGSGSVLKGWDIGMRGMKSGGRRVLSFPPKLAYGAKGWERNGNVIIPPHSCVTFTVDLISVSD